MPPNALMCHRKCIFDTTLEAILEPAPDLYFVIKTINVADAYFYTNNSKLSN